jgi:hypothetical protein
MITLSMHKIVFLHGKKRAAGSGGTGRNSAGMHAGGRPALWYHKIKKTSMAAKEKRLLGLSVLP